MTRMAGQEKRTRVAVKASAVEGRRPRRVRGDGEPGGRNQEGGDGEGDKGKERVGAGVVEEELVGGGDGSGVGEGELEGEERSGVNVAELLPVDGEIAEAGGAGGEREEVGEAEAGDVAADEAIDKAGEADEERGDPGEAKLGGQRTLGARCGDGRLRRMGAGGQRGGSFQSGQRIGMAGWSGSKDEVGTPLSNSASQPRSQGILVW